MNEDQIYQDLVKEFGLETLTPEHQEETLLSLSKSIQKQFFLDIHEKIGAEMFEALEASIKMGDQFYTTTLKHLVPDYEEIFQTSRKKVTDAYKNAATEQKTDMVQ